MKKLLFSFVVLPGALAMAQVGVNTNQPDGSFDVAYIKGAEGTKWGPETPQGVHFPNVSTEQRSKFKNVREGMIIYNTNKKCLEMYLGIKNEVHQWECILNVGSEASQGVAVSPESSSGRFAEGVPFTKENTVSFKITNNGFSAISEVDFSDAVRVENGEGNITVDGTANRSVSLKEGASQTLTYKLSGTPKAGKLTARFSKLGLSAEQVLTVGKGIADLQDQEYYVLSLIHNDIKEQSYINKSNQISLKIPYTKGKGSYDAINITQTTADGQGGDTKQITLSISAGKFSQTGELTATLSVKGDESYQVRQLEPGEIYDIATYDIDISGRKSKVIIKGIGVIPDRKFKEDSRYQFVYLPVTVKGAKGYNKTWLNYNLGAEYANIKSPHFNPTVSKTGTLAHDDAKTYGSLYQWQRASDGHEFRNNKQTTNELADTWKSTGKAAEKFVNRNLNNWVKNGESASGANLQLWQAEGANNPCPSGYHVPTIREWEQLINAVGSNNNMLSQNKLPNLATAGYRSGSSPTSEGTGANYWSSTNYNNSQAYSVGFSNRGNAPNNYLGRAYGFSVRCIKSN